jgi:hypothetical protein
MSGFGISRAEPSVTSQSVASLGFAVGAPLPIKASAKPMAIKGHGPKLNEIFNHFL